jgi:hypothetical protein
MKYRATAIQASLDHFFLLGPKYPQLPLFFPSGIVSIRSFHTDSLFMQEKRLHFMITVGAAGSRFTLAEPAFYTHMLDKTPFRISSRRYFGGFGVNYSIPVKHKLVLDIDLAPCVEIIWDRSEETRPDTSLQETKGFEEIYQGLQLFAHVKLQYPLRGNYALFLSVAGNLPLMNRLYSDVEYSDRFTGQLFIGIGLTYFYKTTHKVENARAKPAG